MASVTATTRSGDQDVDGLLADYRWSLFQGPISYGFPQQGFWSGYPGGSEPYSNYDPLNSTQQGVVSSIFKAVEDFTDLSFWNANLMGQDPRQAVLRFGMTDDTEAAHAYTPYDDEVAGDAWFNNSSGDYDNPVRGDYAWLTFMHEIGHTLGLIHPHDGDIFGTVSLAHDNMNYSAMSYRSYEGMPLDAYFTNEEYGYPQTFMMYDIAAFQHMYGADFTTNNGNTTYKWNRLTGHLSIDGIPKITPGGNVVFLTIWDGGGIDTYDLSDYPWDIVVSLVPGEWTHISGEQRAYLGNGHNALGNIANALLYHGDPRSLIENVTAGGGNDVLNGNQASNLLAGGAGFDRLDGRGGADTLVGGDGDDTYFVDDPADAVVEAAGQGWDRVKVSAASFALGANVEEMTGVSTLGGQSLTGNAGDNFITANNLNGNVLAGGAGADTIHGGSGDDRILGQDGADRLHGFNGADTFEGGAGDDYIDAEGSLGDTIDGGDGDDQIRAGGSGDQIAGGAGADRIEGYAGADSIDGGDGADFIEGNGHGDTIYGGAGDDHLYSDTRPMFDPISGTFRPIQPEDHEGLDILIGGAGADLLEAGVGADRIVYLAVTDSTDGARDTILDFQSGTDKIDFSALPVGTVSLISGEVKVFTPGGTMTINVPGLVVLADIIPPPSAQIVGTDGDDILNGTSGPDEIIAKAGNDVLHGLGGDDILNGGDGNDLLDGGTGADSIDGGSGNDVYVADNDGDSIVEISGGGSDEVRTTLAIASLAALAEVENLTGLGSIDQSLTGNAAANVIDGGLGADTMAGGVGNDVYIVDNAGDQAVEAGGGGTDEIRTALSAFSLAGSAEVEILTGLSNAGQILTGNGLANGISGGSGNDVIDGGAGGDTMRGGLGDDLYTVDSFMDVVTEQADAGTDEVRSSRPSFTLPANVENGTLIGAGLQSLSGNALDNRLIGSSFGDVLSGGAGADYMAGGAGSDSYRVDNVGDVVVENPGEGTDMVDTGLASYTLGANLENLIGLAATGQALTGNGLNNDITGGGGNDVLDGGSGADSMNGGFGNDIYYLHDAGDTVSEFGGGGTDEVRTTLATWSLIPGFEILRGMADTGQTLIGGEYIYAGAGNDTLDGGQTMTGGLGDDIYIIRSFAVSVVETAGQGTDIVYFYAPANGATYTLAENVENLVGHPNGGSNLIGNALDNDIIGGDITNQIDGGLGADTMHGLGGNDDYYVDNVGDVVDELPGQGRDFVYTALASYTLPDHVDALIGTSASGQILGGNSLLNDIFAGDGDDLITSSAGNDRLSGGNGVDTLSYAASDVHISARVELGFVGRTDKGSSGTVYDTFYSIEILEGSNFNDQLWNDTSVPMTLRGLGGGDVLVGGHEADLLDGGAGADQMYGRSGNDIYLVDSAGDLITEYAGEGVDEIRTALAAYDMAAALNVEKLTAATDAAHDFRGNGGDNAIAGAGGNDTLRLQDGGADSASGGGGNDFFLFGASLDFSDAVDGGAGTDQIAIQGNYTLTLGSGLVNIESLVPLPGNDVRFGDIGTNFYDYVLATVDANVAAGQRLTVDANRLRVGEDFTFIGWAEIDGNFFLIGGNGVDNLTGGAQSDTFLFGENGQFGASDVVNGGPGGTNDQLGLRGDYAITFGASQLVSIESIALVSSQDTRFGPRGSVFNYNLTMNDGNVAAGQLFTVDAAPLRGGETLTFNGSAEQDGSFRVAGGTGNDTITGGAQGDILIGRGGADTMTGGAGNDQFRYNEAADSTPLARDTILDFTTGDIVDLSRIDAIAGTPANDAFTFIGATAFSNVAGQLRAYQSGADWLVEGDTNGDGAADLFIQLTGPTPLAIGDFSL